MPRYNAMYHFLSNGAILSPGFQLAKRSGLSYEKQYRVININNTAGIRLIDASKTYILDDHHIRIDQQYDPRLEGMSHSHYTATLIDSDDGSRYQLHVYFNEHAVLAQDPVLLKIDPAGGPSARFDLSDTLRFKLNELANQHYKPTMDELSRQMKTHILGLNRQYKAHERAAATIMSNEPFDLAAYTSELDDACVLLSDLMAFVPSGPYERIKELLERIIAIARTSAIRPEREVMPVSDAPVAVAVEHEPALAAAIPSVTALPAVPKLDDEIEKHVTTYTLLPREDDFFYFSGILELLADVNALSFETNRVSKAALLKLQTLQSSLYNDIEALYPRLLMAEKFDVLDDLESFHHLISTEILEYALSKPSIKLLEFILKHGSIDIQSEPVVVRGHRHANALKYCYETQNMALFLALIQNNVSTLALDDDGLPFTYKILSTPKHPLKATLLDPSVSSKTVDSIPFNKKLIAILTCYLASKHDLEPGVAHEINGQIAAYKLKLTGLKQVSSSASGKALQLVCTGVETKHGEALFIHRLKADPAFIEEAGNFQRYVDSYLRKQSKQKRTQLERKANNFYSDIDDLLSTSDLTGLTYEMVFAQTLDYFHNCRLLMDAGIQLAKVTAKLQGRSGTYKKESVQQKQERTQLADLNKRVLELQTRILNPYSPSAATMPHTSGLTACMDEMHAAFGPIIVQAEQHLSECKQEFISLPLNGPILEHRLRALNDMIL